MRKVRGSRAPAGALWVTPWTMREFAGRRNSAIALPLVGARLGRDRLDLGGERVQVPRPVVETGLARSVDPHQGVLEPVLVVALGMVLARVRAAALGTVGGRVDRGARLQPRVFALEGLDEVAVPDERAVADAHVRKGGKGGADALDALRQAL